MYKATFSGSSYDSKRVRYSWSAGEEVEAPKGSLDHVEGLEWIGKKEPKKLKFEDIPGADDLSKAGLDTVEKVKEATDEELLAVSGIGKSSLKKIREIV